MSYDLKGLTCKQCKKKYHNCGSCGYVEEEVAYSNDCCSFECLRATKEFLEATENTQTFYDSLSEEQKKQFVKYQEDQYHYGTMDLYKPNGQKESTEKS